MCGLSNCQGALIAMREVVGVCAGDTGVSGRPSSSKSGPMPEQTLEGFRNLDSSAQLAFLQRLAAAKPETIDNKWLQACQSFSKFACYVPCFVDTVHRLSSMITSLALSSRPSQFHA